VNIPFHWGVGLATNKSFRWGRKKKGKKVKEDGGGGKAKKRKNLRGEHSNSQIEIGGTVGR